jgi:hypothetical protein
LLSSGPVMMNERPFMHNNFFCARI